jgi:hypothetical protein
MAVRFKLDTVQDPSAVSEVYSRSILEQAPRILSLMDRELLSPTIGCGDRTYWAWKFVDFPGARFQESLCVLGFLYSTELGNSSYFRNPRLLDWIGHGLRFWSSIQHRDGSFDEAYPFERSLAATAFTSFYVGEALTFVGDSLPEDTTECVRQTMERAGEWLTKNDESHGFLSNHLAAAAAALYHIYRITGDKTFEQRSRYFLERIMDHQSDEGWYEEYGGADPGYQTHGSFYLVRHWQLSQNEHLAASLGRSMDFLAHFVHPDGSLGGEYASRNTQTYYPAAFEMFATRHSAAAWIAESMRPSLLNGAAAGLRCIDSYNYFPFLNNLVFAYRACAEEGRLTVQPEEPSSQPVLRWFPEAGIVRIRRQRYDAYVGTAKGGVVKVFDRSRRRLVYSDCGYIGQLRGGQILSTQYQGNNRVVNVSAERVEVDGSFVEVSRPTMNPRRFVALRLFTLSVGRLSRLGRWFKSYLVKVLIYRKRALKIRFQRIIEFGDASISISDQISGPDGKRVENLQWGETFTTIHMGSSRYFINNELVMPTTQSTAAKNMIDPQRISSGVELQRVVTFQ